MKNRKGFLLVMMLTVTLTMSVATINVQAATPEEIENAIKLGLKWLAARQLADGSWGTSDKVARTGFAVLKFETHATRQGIDPLDPSYEYYNQVRKGLDYLFSRAVNVTITDEPAGNPDTDGDGRGVTIWYNSGHKTYETGIAAMAIAASTHPEMTVNVLGSPVNGATYEEVLVDVVDWLAWAQTDPAYGNYRGGWRYAGDNGSSDNSVSGYAVLGLVYAESPAPIGFGLTVPQFVKDELERWIEYIQYDNPGHHDDGGSGYTSPSYWINILKTGNLLQQMAFAGYPLSNSSVQRAIAYIERHWNEPNTDPGWKNGTNTHTQAAYTCMKGFQAFGIELIDTDGDGVRDDDWFDQMAGKIVSEQIKIDDNSDGVPDRGYWPGDPYGDSELDTLWALLVLQKEAPPVTKYDLTVIVKDASTGNPISGASVEVDGPESRSGTTGGDGSILFADLLVGDYDVTASASGYLPGSESLTLDEDKTIEISLTPRPVAIIQSSDQNGKPKNIFKLNDNVYGTGSGFPADSFFDVFVTLDMNWTDGMPIPPRVPGTATTVSSDSAGNIAPTLLWDDPLMPGKYDIVVDVNDNGMYDEGVDALDNDEVFITAGFFIVPEYPLGTILGLAMTLAALAVLKTKRIRLTHL